VSGWARLATSLALVLTAGCSLVLDPSKLMGVGDGGTADGTVDTGLDGDARPPDGDPGDSASPDGGDGGGGTAPARDIAAGRAHTCAIRDTDGDVFCWGDNSFGQAGQSTGGTIATPTRVAGFAEPIAQISLGETHSCARDALGDVFCWGNDGGAHGRLGDATFGEASSYVPRQVSDIAGAIDIEVGFWHACAIVQGSAVRCWGQNASGELGDGCSSAPCPQVDGSAPVMGLSGLVPVAVAAGAGSSCVVTDNSVYCWGFNEGRQLGFIGATPAEPTELTVEGIVDIAAGGGDTFVGTGNAIRGHICAITMSEELLCWGANDAGQVSSNSSVVETDAQLQVLSGVTDVALGYRHTCAVYDGGQVTCWGSSEHGATAAEADIEGATRAPITLPSGALRVTAGERHSCTLLEDGSIYCWGTNDMSQLGAPGSPTSPVRVELPAE
jgi:alpha-tubulin suppressor-like RCC1 family protein